MTYAKRRVKYGSFWVVEENDGKPLACFKSREMAREFIRTVKYYAEIEALAAKHPHVGLFGLYIGIITDHVGVKARKVAFSQVHND